MGYTEGFGALFSEKDVRDYRIACASVQAKFPQEFELKMPNVKSQGNVGSCVAHSIATTIEYFNAIQNSDNEEMSVGYIYGNRTNSKHKGTGMCTRDALDVTCKYGDVKKELFPYNNEVPYIIDQFNSVKNDLFELGTPNRFSYYYKLYTANEIKTSLLNNGPVIFGIMWYDDIEVVNGVIVTKQTSSSYGGHCMVIYGWDERGWKIQNSWSKQWGNGGRAILPYDVKIVEAWGVIDTLYDGTNLSIIKPYNSRLGRVVAKILNFFIKKNK